jgi:hypothetical protein
MITLYGGAVAVVMSLAVGWVQFDLPVPATHNDIVQVQQYAADTRVIVLNQEWSRLEAELRRAEAEHAKNPSNAMLSSISRLKAAIRGVSAAVSELSR